MHEKMSFSTMRPPHKKIVKHGRPIVFLFLSPPSSTKHSHIVQLQFGTYEYEQVAEQIADFS